jgi:UDP-2,3-diacylglucosamine pyrophosphatase LpxH
VVQKVLRRARHGERVVFIPGNHDEALRDYVDIGLRRHRVVEEAVHTMRDGRRFLLMHGDAFDQVTRHHRWVAVLGDVSYNWLVRANRWVSWLRRKLGLAGYWSLAGYAKRASSGAQLHLRLRGERRAPRRIARLDGIVCGHIHCAVDQATSTASPTSTAATGWIPAPPSSSTSTAAWSWSNGMRRRSPCSPRPSRGKDRRLMRVLMVSDVYFPRVNGVSTSIETFRQTLVGQGVEVRWSRRATATSRTPGVVRVPAGRCRATRRTASSPGAPCIATVREQAAACDLVHIQTPFAAHYAGLRAARARACRCWRPITPCSRNTCTTTRPFLPAGGLRALARPCRAGSATPSTASSCPRRRCSRACRTTASGADPCPAHRHSAGALRRRRPRALPRRPRHPPGRRWRSSSAAWRTRRTSASCSRWRRRR